MIKAIGFDLGGVLIDVDYKKLINSFQKLGAKNIDKIYTQASQAIYIDKFERGEIGRVKFREQLKTNLIGLKPFISDTEFDKAWNAMLLEFNIDKLLFLKELKDKGYIVFLFSNIDEIHYEGIMDICNKMGISALFDECLNEKYFSHKFGFNKPSAIAFRKLAKDLRSKHQINSGEILFIDDSRKHIEGRENYEKEEAKSVGFHGLWIKSNLGITQFKKLIFQKIALIDGLK